MRGQGSQRVLERERELAEIAAALDAARAAEGRLLLIEGPAGIGKTSLLEAAAELAAERGLRALAAAGAELGSDYPFGVVRELLEPLVGRTGAAEERRLFAGAAGLCAPLFAGHPASPGRDERAAPLHGLYWLLANLTDEAPLVLLCDDAHWADPRSVDFLAFLAPRVGELALALLVAARPTAAGDPLAAVAPEQPRIRPCPLSRDAARTFTRARLERADAEFCDACHAATGGNPFYLGELLRSVESGGVEPVAASVPQLLGAGPETIARSVLERVAAVSEAAPALARALAILDDGSELRHAAALAGLGEAAATEAAAALARIEVLADAHPPRFAHPVVRAAVYAGMTAAERASGHARAARLLEADRSPCQRVAAALLAAGPVGEPWALERLRTAAAEASAEGAPGLAARYLRRALEEPSDGDRVTLLRELGELEFQAGEPDAVEHLERALAESGGPAERALAARALATPLAGSGLRDRGLAVLEDALTALGPEERALALELEAELSTLALLEPTAAERVMARIERFEDAAGDTPGERIVLGNLAQWLAMTGAPADRAAPLAERALARGRMLADGGADGATFYYAVWILIAADRFEDARRELAAALDTARRQGSMVGFVVGSMMQSLLAYRLGDLARAEAEARGSNEAALLHGWHTGLPATTGFLVDALVDRGELDEAADALAASGLGDDIPDDLLFHSVLVARGRLRIARGELRAGVEDLLELGRRDECGRVRATVGAPTFRTYAAPALAALGEEDEAGRLAAEEVAIAGAWGAPRALGIARRVEGAVAGDPELLGAAVDLLRETPARLELARALADLGAALRRARRPADARAPLREAVELALMCGAAGLAERAARELSATGARRLQRTGLHGPDALTPSELRVARLAADGLTNREIAEALFVTRKTVEMHLSRAYRKLDIAARDELAGALEP